MPRRPPIDTGAKIVALVGAVFLAVSGLIATVFCQGLPTDQCIERRTLEIVGEVTGAELMSTRRINRRSATRIAYRDVVDGVAYADEQLTIDPGLVQAVRQPLARMALQVDRLHPERVRIAGTARSTFGWGGASTLLVPLLGLGLVGAAGVMALRTRG